MTSTKTITNLKHTLWSARYTLQAGHACSTQAMSASLQPPGKRRSWWSVLWTHTYKQGIWLSFQTRFYWQMALLQKSIRSLVLNSTKQFSICVIFEKEVIWCKSVAKIFTISQCIKAIAGRNFQIPLSFDTYRSFFTTSVCIVKFFSIQTLIL